MVLKGLRIMAESVAQGYKEGRETARVGYDHQSSHTVPVQPNELFAQQYNTHGNVLSGQLRDRHEEHQRVQPRPSGDFSNPSLSDHQTSTHSTSYVKGSYPDQDRQSHGHPVDDGYSHSHGAYPTQPPLPPRPNKQQQQPQDQLTSSQIENQGQPLLQTQTPQNDAQSPIMSDEPLSRGSPDCPGFQRSIGQHYYISPSITNFDVCSACYVAYVAPTCFANRLSQVSSNTHGIYCDFAVRATRDAWSEACTRAMLPSATLEDQNNLLSHFNQRQTTIQTQLEDIIDQQNKINNELPPLRRQYETEYALAESDYTCAGVTSAILNTRPDALSFSQPVVHHDVSAQRFMQADRLMSEIRQKEDMGQRILAGQLNDLVV